MRTTLRSLSRDPSAMTGAAIVAVITLLALLAPPPGRRPRPAPAERAAPGPRNRRPPRDR
ncbi:N-terminal TM domain of oligopeptide transport permease C family protein [Nocardiopsis alba ATCC BAA-2165]|uniref:N-terminal TM domain of oligopeptide transport permease C family protein n=1 Tax=Nocardiopsis alba (strain ATCC BAA-2165 / BE74) TaxID=1205910 RepID=J7LEY7_NOCAA|nr:N-terminal TM domain of oligopeptide transport permease C family protein [Nocardiopsis alba ATCC BAA-2165]